MTRTLACLLATALGVTTVAPAQGSVALKGGFSYGNVSNRGVLPGNLQAALGPEHSLTRDAKAMM